MNKRQIFKLMAVGAIAATAFGGSAKAQGVFNPCPDIIVNERVDHIPYEVYQDPTSQFSTSTEHIWLNRFPTIRQTRRSHSAHACLSVQTMSLPAHTQQFRIRSISSVSAKASSASVPMVWLHSAVRQALGLETIAPIISGQQTTNYHGMEPPATKISDHRMAVACRTPFMA